MHNNPCIQLESLVQDAEVHRHVHHTSEVQKYVDTHPELYHHTCNLTNEIKEKLIFYIANGERAKEEHIRGELETLHGVFELHGKTPGAHELDALSPKSAMTLSI